MDWRISADERWLTIAPAAGNGPTALVIGIADYAATDSWPGLYRGTITVVDEMALNNPRTITVDLRVKAAGTAIAPFGSFDSPIDGAAGLAGAIPVTGWALDDVEVVRVEIKREPAAGDPPGAVGADGLVYLGDAVFVPGARPDVEALYPEIPLNHRAGWGYMLLTYGLPDRGNGTFVLHAVATDAEGHVVSLGTKTIFCSNATAVKPFGTIDTPTQGGFAPGNPFLNFGWVLTPFPKTVPKDGSTITVFIDGVRVGTLGAWPNLYNQFRPDVAAAFPGLNNSNGAVGVFFLDTSAQDEGIHTIQWIAVDDAGQADGIGSRYFYVSGGAGPPGPVRTELCPADARGTAAGRAMRPATSPIRLRSGFRPDSLGVSVGPDEAGAYRIEMHEAGRIVLDLAPESGQSGGRRIGGPWTGFLRVGEEERPLPIGSTLDPAAGRFSWMPGPGFLGEYELVFRAADAGGSRAEFRVVVRIVPASHGRGQF